MQPLNPEDVEKRIALIKVAVVISTIMLLAVVIFFGVTLSNDNATVSNMIVAVGVIYSVANLFFGLPALCRQIRQRSMVQRVELQMDLDKQHVVIMQQGQNRRTVKFNSGATYLLLYAAER